MEQIHSPAAPSPLPSTRTRGLAQIGHCAMRASGVPKYGSRRSSSACRPDRVARLRSTSSTKAGPSIKPIRVCAARRRAAGVKTPQVTSSPPSLPSSCNARLRSSTEFSSTCAWFQARQCTRNVRPALVRTKRTPPRRAAGPGLPTAYPWDRNACARRRKNSPSETARIVARRELGRCRRRRRRDTSAISKRAEIPAPTTQSAALGSPPRSCAAAQSRGSSKSIAKPGQIQAKPGRSAIGFPANARAAASRRSTSARPATAVHGG